MNQPPRILIVDDEPFNRDFLSQELEDLEYEPLCAENGEQALQMAQTSNPDLILLDIMMPGLDGFEVLTRLKSDARLRDLPVIVISATNDLRSVVKGIELGAEDYLPKPFEPTLLKARISSSLEKKQLRDERLKLLHTFATKEVAEELVRSGFSLGGNYVQASVMFVDIRSFTTIAESQEPAETIDLLNEYFKLMFAAVNTYRGTINQLIGDGFMVVFGAPIYFEDHRERAVRAALEMLERLEIFNARQTARGRQQLDVGIGIASGRVIAGYAGTETRATYTCVGDPVNLASRIQNHTKAIQRPLLIDLQTRQGLLGSYLLEDLGLEIFRGKRQAVNIFAVSESQPPA